MNSNKFHVFCLGLLLCSAPSDASASSFEDANYPVPPEYLRAALHTFPNEDDFGKLDGGGKLLYQELDPRWLHTLVYFPRGGKRGLILQNNLTAINAFLAAEIRHPKTVRTFLKKYLHVFLADTLASDGMFPITAGIEKGAPTHPEYFGLPSSSAESKRLQKKILPYERSDETIVTGNVWTVDMNALTDEGAVEHWLVKGKVRPLRIDGFLCEPKEPAGTFHRVFINGG